MGSASHISAFSERAAQMGVGLEVANAIRDYLDKAGGDPRLALALSVADAFGSPDRAGVARSLAPSRPEDMH